MKARILTYFLVLSFVGCHDNAVETAPAAGPADTLSQQLPSKIGSSDGILWVETAKQLEPTARKNQKLETTESRILGAGAMTLKQRSVSSESQEDSLYISVVFSVIPEPMSSGDSLTIAPISASIPITTVAVQNVRKSFRCKPDETWWEIRSFSLSPSDFPSDELEVNQSQTFLILYPNLNSAQRIPIDSSQTPNSLTPSTARLALDVTGDSMTDLIAFQYCCNDTSIHPDSTDVTCSRCSSAFHRNAEGAWERTYSTGPC